MIAGRYSLEREIGRGGSGVVWLGRDEILGRQVALKRIGLLPGEDRTDLARAEREARLSAQLNHPHVVAIFDVVVDGDTDARWLVMEYVAGRTLGELVRERGRLAPDEAAPLLWQAADALVAAHQAGIAHRDVKPSNILVDDRDQVKLTDFGIAHISSDPSLTQTGMVTGSPAYLAPEVATGGRGGEPADVWSMGATAYTLLSGRPPYDMGANVLGGLYRIVNEEPPRLGDAGWMAPLLEATMVRDPARRWSMTQVRDFLADRGATVPPAFEDPASPDHTRTQVLTAVAPPAASSPASSAASPEPAYAAAGAPFFSSASEPGDPPPPQAASGASRGRRRRSPALLLLGGLALLLVVGLVAWAVLAGGDPNDAGSSAGPASSGSASPKPSPKASAKASPKPSATATPAEPTAAGMKAFIRDYVAATAEDPSRSWQMLTAKFQAESGGFEKYSNFWGPATNGRVLSIQADPDSLVVSYQVRFDNFDNGPGPTVLDLAFDQGTYRIDGESTKGFTPSG